MRRFLFLILAGVCSAREAENDLLPNFRYSLAAHSYSTREAFCFSGEAGRKNLRGDLSYALYLTPNQRVKLSGEFLSQDLHFGCEKKWVSQYCVSTAYQFVVHNSCLQGVEIGGGYSYGFKRNLHWSNKVYGSKGGYGYLGLTLNPWEGGYFFAKTNYDYVDFRRRCLGKVQGWGGSVNYIQRFGPCFFINLIAEHRAPFNFYEGSINWVYHRRTNSVQFGIYGNYTEGKKGIQNVVTAGIQLSYVYGKLFGQRPICDGPDLDPAVQLYRADLVNWTTLPAISLPTYFGKREKL